MKNTKVSIIISEIILNRNGKFTLTDIMYESKPIIENEFTTENDLKNYVKYKLNSMCDLGLIGKTSLYYFSI